MLSLCTMTESFTLVHSGCLAFCTCRTRALVCIITHTHHVLICTYFGSVLTHGLCTDGYPACVIASVSVWARPKYTLKLLGKVLVKREEGGRRRKRGREKKKERDKESEWMEKERVTEGEGYYTESY